MRTTRVQGRQPNGTSDPESDLGDPLQKKPEFQLHAIDHYEKNKTYCEKTGLLARTYNQFFLIEEMFCGTPFLPVQESLKKKLREKIQALRADFRHEQPVTRQKVVAYRKKIKEIEDELRKVQKDVFFEIFKTLSKDTKASLLGLCLLKTLLDGDLEAASAQAKNPRGALFSEQDVLLRIDPQLLRLLEGVGILHSMSVDGRQRMELGFAKRRRELDKAAVQSGQTNESIKAFLDALNALTVDEGKLNSQILHKGSYYNLNAAYWPVLDRLFQFLEQNRVSSISRVRMNKLIIESLYPDQLLKLCALNIVEAIDTKELKQRVSEDLGQATDYVKSGILHYRIHNDGLCVLREFLKDEKIEVAKSEARAGTHNNLELSVEFY